MPYTMCGIMELVRLTNIEIHIVHYSVSDDAPFKLNEQQNIKFYDKSLLNNKNIEELIKKLNPKFVYVAGWANKDYLKLAQFSRHLGIPTITGCDTQWRSDFRQSLAVLFSKYLIRKYFDFIMIAGFYQYEYARLLGFKRKNILYPMYAADLTIFNEQYNLSIDIKKKNYPRNLLFVGRFEKIKGLKLLISAFKSINNRNGWTLTLIGNGTLKDEIIQENKNYNDIIIKDFLQPEELVKEVAKSGAFCLPSEYEPWGVVIQEFAAAGLLLITSDVCGASSIFLREAFNGYIFESQNLDSLKEALRKLFTMKSDELLLFSSRSNYLANAITPLMYASNFSRFIDK